MSFAISKVFDSSQSRTVELNDDYYDEQLSDFDRNVTASAQAAGRPAVAVLEEPIPGVRGIAIDDEGDQG